MFFGCHGLILGWVEGGYEVAQRFRGPGSRTLQACGYRPTWWDDRLASPGGSESHGLTSPATKHARLVSSPMSAMRRYASLCGRRWKESESAHRKSLPARPRCSAPSPATVRVSHASSCDQTSTSHSQMAGWTGTGRYACESEARHTLRVVKVRRG